MCRMAGGGYGDGGDGYAGGREEPNAGLQSGSPTWDRR